MGKLTIRCKTSLSNKQFITALTDFGPGRGKVWGNSQSKYLQIHAVGPTSADITEGSGIFGGVWEQLQYDWSDPDNIVLTTVDSNYWKPGSNWRYTFSSIPNSDETCITFTIERFPLNLKARLAMVLIGIAGKIILTQDFNKTLRVIEQQYI
jgi:hypothetical protein